MIDFNNDGKIDPCERAINMTIMEEKVNKVSESDNRDINLKNSSRGCLSVL